MTWEFTLALLFFLGMGVLFFWGLFRSLGDYDKLPETKKKEDE